MKKHWLLFIALCTAAQAAFCQQHTMAVDTLPAPFATQSVRNFSDVVGWGKGEIPIAPKGFTVTKFADGFDNPRWIYLVSNGDVLVVETNNNFSEAKKIGGAIIGANKADNMTGSANRITLLRGNNGDGTFRVRKSLVSHLNQPFGVLVYGQWLYVANTDGLWRFTYKPGDDTVGDGEKILELPAGKHNRHWCRNLIVSKDGRKILIAVGSGSNVAEDGLPNEIRRADILEINPDGSGERIYASGLRNPCGMGWEPVTGKLWTSVNERDELGDNLVPDYLTSVEEGGFYGWPYCYYGNHVDPRVKEQRPDLVAKAIVPDLSLGSHTASLGMVFYTKKAFPAHYQGGVFIGQHGSWNRSELAGYKVVFVPFANGKPSGPAEDFLTGFVIDPKGKKVHGRPVGTFVMDDGSLLVTDDVANTIWRVTAN